MSQESEGKSLINDLTSGDVARQLLFFAAPLFLSGLLQTVYNMVDMIVVGHFVGKEGLAAVSVGGEVLLLLTFVATGMSNAGQIIISQYIGAKQIYKVTKLIGTMFSFLLICALFMTFVCLIMQKHILKWINMPLESYQYGADYIIVCICGLVFIYGYNLVSAILRGMGDSKYPFLFIAIASVINVILDFIFIVGLHMEVKGAALATVIGQAASFLISLIYLYNHKKEFGFDFRPKSFRIDMEVLRPLVILGIPMILQSAAITFSKLFVTSWINTYGVVASVVSGIGNKLQAITNVFAQALSTAGGSMIAQNIGAEKYERVPKVIYTSFAFDGAITVMLSVITFFFPQFVFSIFTSDTEVMEMAFQYIPVALLLYLSCVLRPPMNSLINGSGNYRLNLLIAILDGIVVRIGLAYFLGETCGLGIYGFWYGNAFSSFMPFLIGMPYYLSGKWKLKVGTE